MSILWITLVLVALQRLGELAYAARNTRRLLARGAVEIGRAHYPLFVLLQLGRVWVVATLGPYWTTRIITLPEVPLVRRGPYRFVSHPNYLIVTGEIAVLPLAFGAWPIALVFSVLNAALLAWRIRIENGTLTPRRALGQAR